MSNKSYKYAKMGTSRLNIVHELEQFYPSSSGNFDAAITPCGVYPANNLGDTFFTEIPAGHRLCGNCARVRSS